MVYCPDNTCVATEELCCHEYWCDGTQSCVADINACCDSITSGDQWCDNLGECDDDCCADPTMMCDEPSSPNFGTCTLVTDCCPSGMSWCGTEDQCTILSNCDCASVDETFCDALQTCSSSADCCEDDSSMIWCTLFAPAGECINIEDCCETDQPWCDAIEACATDASCCAAQQADAGKWWWWDYTTSQCCSSDMPYVVDGVCCSGDDCCASGTQWNSETETCETCDCSECCDFSCCDELDYFIHRAYDEMYSSEYATFDEYYADWYADFYNWWYNGESV